MTIAEREQLLLAPFATHSADSCGRRHPEPEHPYRGPFQRDRDRILHSSAYRRLSGKTQVFTGEMGDYHRTRLTHTQEVASIARTIGRALQLNEDLVEALALFHDIGHPPFGHAGEDALNDCLAKDGGFSHNRYALTIAEELEFRYHEFPGLNLSLEVLEGQAFRADKSSRELAPSLEAQVVDVADSITYDAHDTDDAIKLGLVSLDQLAENALMRELLARIDGQLAAPNKESRRKAVVHALIDLQVNDVLIHSARQLAAAGFESAAAARQSGFRIGPSSELGEKKVQLEDFLYHRVYRHPRLVEVRRRAQERLHVVFARLVEMPDRLPPRFRRRIERVGIRRAVGDYLAGMTDRFCDEQFRILSQAPVGG